MGDPRTGEDEAGVQDGQSVVHAACKACKGLQASALMQPMGWARPARVVSTARVVAPYIGITDWA
jgi:hypothetical protein